MTRATPTDTFRLISSGIEYLTERYQMDSYQPLAVDCGDGIIRFEDWSLWLYDLDLEAQPVLTSHSVMRAMKYIRDNWEGTELRQVATFLSDPQTTDIDWDTVDTVIQLAAYGSVRT